MKIKVNNVYYEILETSMGNTVLGLGSYGKADYINKKIYLGIDERPEEAIKEVLIHELTHAFMEEYMWHDKNSYDREDMCDVVAVFSEEIISKANEYMENRGKDNE